MIPDNSAADNAGIAQLVEHNLAKVGVAGSNPVSRSRREQREGPRGPFWFARADTSRDSKGGGRPMFSRRRRQRLGAEP